MVKKDRSVYIEAVPYAKSERTQRKLIESTARLLRTRGYAATGLTAIVAESGVPKGSLYHHFPGGKEALAAAAISHAGDEVVTTLARMIDAADDPARAIRDYVNHCIAELRASDYQRGSPLATVALEAAAHVEAVHEACSGAFDDVVELLAGRLERKGVRGPDAESVALLTVAAIEGALVLSKASRDCRALEAVRDQLVRGLERSIGGRS